VSDIVVPGGLIDIQVNGGWGHDFTSDPTTIWDVGARLPSTGVTAFVPTIITAPYEVAASAIEVLQTGPPPGYLGARVIGLHIEGPWISPIRNGAHPLSLLKDPDLAVAEEWARSGVVSMVTIAPELSGATEVAGILANAGVVVSAGHSDADVETARSALDGAFGAVTHLFNQMSPLKHRAPGLVGAALESDAPCGMIVDGLHSHNVAVELAWDVLGPDRMILITDAMAATGLGHGHFDLGHTEVVVGDDGPRTNDGRLAGSALTLDRALANLIEITGATIQEALAAVTTTPARLLGYTSSATDTVTLGNEVNVLSTRIDGELVFEDLN